MLTIHQGSIFTDKVFIKVPNDLPNTQVNLLAFNSTFASPPFPWMWP